MKEISYHIAGLLMLVTIAICYNLNKKTPLLHNKCYLVFVLSIVMTTVAAIFTDGITDHIGINTVKYISYGLFHNPCHVYSGGASLCNEPSERAW